MAQVDLLLARAVLVERVLDGDAELLEVADRLLAQVAGGVERAEVEEAVVVERLWLVPAGGRVEVEELDVGRDVERVAQVAGGLGVAAQHLARVATERCAVEVEDVAEHACLGGPGLAPRDQLERVGIGHGEHVGLLDAREAVDRRSVEGHPVVERVLELGRADGEALEVAEHVGEPQAHEPDTALLDGSKDVVALLIEHLAHLLSLLAWCGGGGKRTKNSSGAPQGPARIRCW